jgi:hypothetical protein
MKSFFILVLTIISAPAAVLDPAMHHLGIAGQPEWDEFRNVPVEGPLFELKFTAEKNTNEWTLFIRQRDVKVAPSVTLNGRAFTNLFLSEDALLNAFSIPAGTLRDGTNTLAIPAKRARRYRGR